MYVLEKMFITQDFLLNLLKVAAVWILYLAFVAMALRAINKNKRQKRQRIMKAQQNAEKERLKIRIEAEDYERVGRYEEAAILYEESGELEKARQCRMLADFLTKVNQQ